MESRSLGSVLGARYPAFGVNPAPVAGTKRPVLDAWNPVLEWKAGTQAKFPAHASNPTPTGQNETVSPILLPCSPAYPVCGFFGTGTGNSVEISAFHPGIRCQVPATWRLVPDTRYWIRTEGRIPSTEDRA